MSGAVIHFEIPADDLERAQAFYRQAFGWVPNPQPALNYVLVSTTPTDDRGMPQQAGAINGGMMARQDPVRTPVVTIEVASIPETLSRVEELGGRVVLGRQAVGDMGYSAYVQDTEGNVVGLWEHPAQTA